MHQGSPGTHDLRARDDQRQADFEAFLITAEPVLRRALVAAYGYQDGREAAAEALAWAWEHWDRVRQMPNPVGYLYRVAQSSLSRSRRWNRHPPVAIPPVAEHHCEPGLAAAIAALSERQRIAVVLVHGFGYTLREVAELTGTKISTIQNHLERGLRRLRDRLGVESL